MLLSPEYENKFNNAKTLKDKIVVLYGKQLGLLISKGFQKSNINPTYKEEILTEVSSVKEFYDRFLKQCDKFNSKNIDEQAEVIADYLLRKIPQEWVQEFCNFNNIMLSFS